MSEPTLKELKDADEMSRGCFEMIKEKLVDLGIRMDRCPPMFYPEAIHNLYVWTAKASRDCMRDHQWHGKDESAAAKCIHDAVIRYGLEKDGPPKKQGPKK